MPRGVLIEIFSYGPWRGYGSCVLQLIAKQSSYEDTIKVCKLMYDARVGFMGRWAVRELNKEVL